jgi:cysteine-rich repeat protein
MQPLDVFARTARRAATVMLLPASIAAVSLAAGCATSATGATSGGGEGGDTTTTTTGQGGSGGSGGSGTAGGSGGTGGSGGATTTTTSTTTTTTTTSTTSTGVSCMELVETAGHPLELESNNLPSKATPLAAGALGFTASLCPLGDIDVFAIPITIPGASLRAEVTEPGGGGCPPGAQTFMRVFDSNNVVLAQDVESGAAGCSLVTPADWSGIAALPVGTYNVQIENITLTKLDAYQLDIAVKAPACGDGVLQSPAGEQCDDGNLVPGDGCTADCLVEAVCGDGVTHIVAGEQCDDGNAAPGDGCSATCQFEATLLTESEPNTKSTPNSLVGYDGAIGSIDPTGDQDWFSFEVTVPGSSVSISTSNGLGKCPIGADTQIYLYDPAGQLLADDDDDGDNSCSLIAPPADDGATNLPAGTYKILVEEFGNNDSIEAYVLLVQLNAPGCGDGVVQVDEDCDDGNTAAADGCSPMCLLEGNYTHEVEPNPLATANSLTGFDGVIASIDPVGDQDVFSFDVTVPGSSVTIEVSNGYGGCPGFDSVITLFDPLGVELAQDDSSGISPCSKISPDNQPAAMSLGAGKHKVQVAEFLNDEIAAKYVLSVKVVPPSCGDLLLAMGEQCDDGNTLAGDGCSDLCQSESPWEIEPNGTLNTATALWPATSGWKGSIQSIGDRDWYKLTVQAGQSLTAAVHTIGNPGTCPFDSEIHLVNAAGLELVVDDDDGIDNCSLITPVTDAAAANLPAGAYYVWVRTYGDGAADGPYQLDLTVQ